MRYDTWQYLSCTETSLTLPDVVDKHINISLYLFKRWSQYPRGLMYRSTAARLLGLRVRIPSEAWMSVYYECRVLSGRGLCDKPITRPEEYYRLWCVLLCDIETSRIKITFSAFDNNSKGNKMLTKGRNILI